MFNGTLIRVESDEGCRFQNLLTITSVFELRTWSLEELRLQDYYHGYKCPNAAGVPQSSNKRSFGGFLVGSLSGACGTAATKRKLDNGTSAEMTKCIICLDKKVKHDSHHQMRSYVLPRMHHSLVQALIG